MALASNDGLNVYYEVHGTGEPVVFISGLTMNSIPWSFYQLDAFTSAGYQVILIDNRDVGKSDEATQSYLVSDMATDVVAVMQAAGLSAAHIVGYSLGGMIGQQLALTEPEKVLTLTTLGSTAKQGGYEQNLIRVVLAAKSSLSAEEFWRFMGTKVLTWRFFENEGAVEKWLGFVLSADNHQSVQGTRRQAAACYDFNVLDKLNAIQCPVHVIAGEEDIMLAPRHSALIAEHITGAKLSMIASAGHSAYSENAERFNALALEFLA